MLLLDRSSRFESGVRQLESHASKTQRSRKWYSLCKLIQFYKRHKVIPQYIYIYYIYIILRKPEISADNQGSRIYKDHTVPLKTVPTLNSFEMWWHTNSPNLPPRGFNHKPRRWNRTSWLLGAQSLIEIAWGHHVSIWGQLLGTSVTASCGFWILQNLCIPVSSATRLAQPNGYLYKKIIYYKWGDFPASHVWLPGQPNSPSLQPNRSKGFRVPFLFSLICIRDAPVPDPEIEQALLLGMGTNHSDAKLRTTITSRNWVLTIQASQLVAGCTMVAPIPHPPFPTLPTIQNSCHPRIPMKQNTWFNPNHQKKHRHKRYKRKQKSQKKNVPNPQPQAAPSATPGANGRVPPLHVPGAPVPAALRSAPAASWAWTSWGGHLRVAVLSRRYLGP